MESINKQKILVISLLCIVCFSCKDSGAPISLNTDSFPKKDYTLNENGQVVSSEISISDFESAVSCKGCHFDHWEEWSQSMHAYAMTDPVFFSGWNREQNNRPNTGERFCIQCHSPAAFVTGYPLADFGGAEDFIDTQLPQVITEGISCDVCHSTTDLSPTIHTKDKVAATATYYLNPGNIKYGNIQNPVPNDFHDSKYNPIYSNSAICLPCHNITVRGIEAEITYSEWDRIPGAAMGLLACQECHMPTVTRPAAVGCSDGTCPDRVVHSHTFVGVDLDLSQPAESNPQFDIVTDLLKNALTLDFGTPYDSLTSNVIAGDSLAIPITITSQTAHSIPSGVSFAREAWLEIVAKIVRANKPDTVFFQSGVVSDSTSLDITTDPNLLLFTSYLIDSVGDTTGSITNVHSIINNSLMAFSKRNQTYKVKIPSNITGEIKIRARMRFRSFKPDILRGSHQNLLENLPIFEMAEDSAVVNISL